MEPILRSRGDCARRAGISERHLDRLLKAGNGPRITRLGGRVLIRDDHFREWLDDCSAETPANGGAA